MTKKQTRAERNISWCEKHLRIPEGKFVGQPLKMAEYMKDDFRAIYDNPNALTRRAIISRGRKNAKSLELNTPIPTIDGWKKMADIKIGDFVFSPDGKPTRVSNVSEIFENKDCYKLTFSDGSEIVASHEHLWETTHSYTPWKETKSKRSGNGGRWKTGIVTTEQIFQSVHRPRLDGGKESNHKIKLAEPIEFPEVNLPIDPYFFGYWLGDGTSSCERITIGSKDFEKSTENLERSLNCKFSFYENPSKPEKAFFVFPEDKEKRFNILKVLRKLNLKNNKHIPELFFIGSITQRLSLLQGLLDSDGTVATHGGQTTPRVSFCSMKENLSRDVWRLARSLGFKATLTSREAKIKGKSYGNAFYVTFPADNSRKLFRLERKQKLLPEKLGKRSSTITIVSCEKVESVPTKCISVEHESHLYLAGHGCIVTHNTTETAMILLLHLCGPEARPNSQLFSAAQSRDQAAILFALAAKMIRMSEQLNKVTTVRDTAKEILCPELGSKYKALSADASTSYGLSPSLIIHDELGQVRGPKFELYDALESATAAQENPLSIVISTQAPNDGDLLSVLIDDALKGEDPKTVLRFNTAPDEMDPFSIEALEAANPAFHVFMNKTEVLDMQASAKRMPTSQAEFENLILNRRVETKAPFITAPVWKACNFPVDSHPTNPIFGGLDLSGVSDLTALVYVQQIDDEDTGYKWHVTPNFWIPGVGIKDKEQIEKVPYTTWADQENRYINLVHNASTIEYEYIAAQIMADVKEGKPIKKIAFDRYNYKHLKPWLKHVGFKEEDVEGDQALFVEFGQGFISMSPALRSIESLILNKKIAHGNHPVLSWNVSNAVAVSDPAGNRKLIKNHKKGNSAAKIDGLVALTMAIGIAETLEIKPKKTHQMLFI